MTRCISLVGRTRSSIRLLTDSMLSDHTRSEPPKRDPLGELALLADDAADSRQLGPQRLVGGDDVVEPVGDLARHARPFERHAHGEVAALDVGQHAQQHRLVEATPGCKSPIRATSVDRSCVVVTAGGSPSERLLKPETTHVISSIRSAR